MPKSKVRKKPAYTPPPRPAGSTYRPSPRWLVPAMLFFLVLGVAWLITFYITEGDIFFMDRLGGWNILVGFGSMLVGFILATRWR